MVGILSRHQCVTGHIESTWIASINLFYLGAAYSKYNPLDCLKLPPVIQFSPTFQPPNDRNRHKCAAALRLVWFNSTQLNSTQRCFYCQILAHHSTTKSTNYYTSVGKYYTKYNLHVKRLHIMWPVPDNGSWKPQRVCGPLVWYKSMVQKGALCNRRTTPISKGGYDSCKNR